MLVYGIYSRQTIALGLNPGSAYFYKERFTGRQLISFVYVLSTSAVTLQFQLRSCKRDGVAYKKKPKNLLPDIFTESFCQLLAL